MPDTFATELRPDERTWLNQALAAGEELRLLVRPRSEPELVAFNIEHVLSGIFLLVCLGITVSMAMENPLSCVLMLPAWLVGTAGVCWPWLWSWRRRRTLYVLTSRRVLLREVSRTFRVRCHSYPLQAGMVQEVGVLPGGYGHIVFDYAWDEMNGAREERVTRQVGFVDIPQVKRVQALLERAIAENEEKRKQGVNR